MRRSCCWTIQDRAKQDLHANILSTGSGAQTISRLAGLSQGDGEVWGSGLTIDFGRDLTVLGVAAFPSCGDVFSFYSGLRIQLRVHPT